MKNTLLNAVDKFNHPVYRDNLRSMSVMLAKKPQSMCSVR